MGKQTGSLPDIDPERRAMILYTSGTTGLPKGSIEIGMAISNPYRGERKPGYIGQALPGVKIYGVALVACRIIGHAGKIDLTVQ